ncbi:MAG TPA: glycosyltransferase [Candidatus Limnocylindrales bacterium]|nr:glycosyltransferase [Candidatus Limnocylindrales bacterium]
MKPALTLVVPCHNEEQRLDLAAFHQFLDDRPWSRLCFVDDGSSDRTHSVLARFCEQSHGRADSIRLPQNRGKAGAVREGMKWAFATRASLVGYWDADLATPLDAVDGMVNVLNSNPELVGVMGCRLSRLGAYIQRDPLRHYIGRLFATLASAALGLSVYDTQCGAKLFRNTPAIQNAFAKPFLCRWAFDVELIARLQLTEGESIRYRLYEFPLERWADAAGSGVTLRAGAVAFIDLWRIYRAYRRQTG